MISTGKTTCNHSTHNASRNCIIQSYAHSRGNSSPWSYPHTCCGGRSPLWRVLSTEVQHTQQLDNGEQLRMLRFQEFDYGKQAYRHLVSGLNWFCTPTSPLMLRPLLISDSWVLLFQVSSTKICALSRGDSTGAVLLVSRTQHQAEVPSEKAQAIALQSVWAITPRWLSNLP